MDLNLHSISSQDGISSTLSAKKHGFKYSVTDNDYIFKNNKINAVVIATRHDSHAGLVIKALKAKKNIFVEKPLCMNLKELDSIRAAHTNSSILMVGFNRRFAPQIRKMKFLLSEINEPKAFVMTINAGEVANDHWTQDPDIGGGRVLGEACHFIDLLRFLAGSSIKDYKIDYLKSSSKDTATIQLNFEDGSIGTIHYYSNGSNKLSKERLEVFAGGGVLQLDNFRKLNAYGWPGFKKMNLWQQDKGQKNCVRSFIDAIISREVSPIPKNEIYEVSRIAIDLANQ